MSFGVGLVDIVLDVQILGFEVENRPRVSEWKNTDESRGQQKGAGHIYYLDFATDLTEGGGGISAISTKLTKRKTNRFSL